MTADAAILDPWNDNWLADLNGSSGFDICPISGVRCLALQRGPEPETIGIGTGQRAQGQLGDAANLGEYAREDSKTFYRAESGDDSIRSSDARFARSSEAVGDKMNWFHKFFGGYQMAVLPVNETTRLLLNIEARIQVQESISKQTTKALGEICNEVGRVVKGLENG